MKAMLLSASLPFVGLLTASNATMLIHERRVPHQLPLPDCPTGTQLCDFFIGAYCYNATAGDNCCDDGSGRPFGLDFPGMMLICRQGFAPEGSYAVQGLQKIAAVNQ